MLTNYYYTHANIASHTGLTTKRVGRLASDLASVLDTYRISGDKNKYLYNTSGLKVWEQIYKMTESGIGPKAIEENLRKLIGIQGNSVKQQSSPNAEYQAKKETIFHDQEKFYQDLGVGERLEREHQNNEKSLYQTLWEQENKRIEDLKEAHRRELQAKDETIEILKDTVESQKVFLLSDPSRRKKGFFSRMFSDEGKQE